MKVSKVPHLSRKSSLYRKCRACHAKRRGATADPGCRQASADLYEGLESATLVTQIEPEVPKVPRLSRKTPRTPVLCCVVLCCFVAFAAVVVLLLLLLLLRRSEVRKEGDGMLPQQKQKPHNTMWGITKYFGLRDDVSFVPWLHIAT